MTRAWRELGIRVGIEIQNDAFGGGEEVNNLSFAWRL